MTVSYSGLTVTAGTTITATWGNMVRDACVVPHATAAARTSAVTSPAEAMLSYRTDGKVFEAYDGSNWVAAARYSVASRKTANETVNNSAALQNDDHLSWAVAANAVYGFQLWLSMSSGTTPDFKFAWTYPSGLTMNWGYMAINTSGTFDHPFGGTESTTVAIGGIGAGSAIMIVVTGIVTVGSTAGTLQLQWAQNTANASDTIVYAGSWGILTRLA